MISTNLNKTLIDVRGIGRESGEQQVISEAVVSFKSKT